MSANRHPNWLKEARRAEGGGVAKDDEQRSNHLDEMMKHESQGSQVGNGVLDQAMKHSSNYEDMINRANESGADPADVQDVLQGAMDRNKGD